MIDAESFVDWLRRYGQAWIDGDPQAAAELFTDDAAYHEKPFEPPMVGRAAIVRYWTAGAKDSQREVAFRARPVGIDGSTGYARWSATFVRLPGRSLVELEGILAAQFGADGRCSEFREWWHRRETGSAA